MKDKRKRWGVIEAETGYMDGWYYDRKLAEELKDALDRNLRSKFHHYLIQGEGKLWSIPDNRRIPIKMAL